MFQKNILYKYYQKLVMSELLLPEKRHFLVVTKFSCIEKCPFLYLTKFSYIENNFSVELLQNNI